MEDDEAVEEEEDETETEQNDNKHSTHETMLALAQVRSHLQSLGENSQVFDALKSIERVFIKKSIEESHTKQTKVSNFFPTTQLVLR